MKPSDRAKTKERARYLKSKLASAEKAMAKLEASLTEIDRAIGEPASAPAHLADVAMSDLLVRRSQVGDDLARAEADWLVLGEELEKLEKA